MGETKIGKYVCEVFSMLFLFMAGILFGLSLALRHNTTFQTIGYVSTMVLLAMVIIFEHRKDYYKILEEMEGKK